MSMPKKTHNESGYPLGDPSRSFLRFLESEQAPGVNPDDFKVVGGEGASEPAAPADPPAAPPAPPADPPKEPAGDAPKEPADPPKEPAKEPETPPWGDPKNFDPEKAWNLIQNLRGDKATNEQRIADARKEASTQAQKDLVTKWAKELGVIEDPQKPEDLLTAVTQERDGLKQDRDGKDAENRLLKVELNVHRIGQRLGADVEAVLDSREMEAKFRALDPASDDFGSQVERIVSEAVDKNPARYRKAQVAPVSGGDFSGGNGGGAPKPADEDDIEKLRETAAKRKESRL